MLSHFKLCFMLIENVMVQDGTFVAFVNGNFSIEEYNQNVKFPPIQHQKKKLHWKVNVPVKLMHGELPMQRCRSYFNGTLHVSGRKVIHKLFHTCKSR